MVEHLLPNTPAHKLAVKDVTEVLDIFEAVTEVSDIMKAVKELSSPSPGSSVSMTDFSGLGEGKL